MISYCVYAFIQRSYLILSLPDSEPLNASVREMQNSARASIESTATTMTKIAEELQELRLIRYLPHSAVFGFVLVSLMYLLDLTAVNDIEGISQSMRMMDVFRDSYFDTTYMSRTVNLVFNRESIKPMSGDSTLSYHLEASHILQVQIRHPAYQLRRAVVSVTIRRCTTRSWDIQRNHSILSHPSR